MVGEKQRLMDFNIMNKLIIIKFSNLTLLVSAEVFIRREL